MITLINVTLISFFLFWICVQVSSGGADVSKGASVSVSACVSVGDKSTTRTRRKIMEFKKNEDYCRREGDEVLGRPHRMNIRALAPMTFNPNEYVRGTVDQNGRTSSSTTIDGIRVLTRGGNKFVTVSSLNEADNLKKRKR